MWGIQRYNDWLDYPCWEDDDAYENRPIRYASAEEAQRVIDLEICIFYAKRFRETAANAIANKPAQDIYEKRKQCLIDNDLWVQEWEKRGVWNTNPLVFISIASTSYLMIRFTPFEKRVVKDEDMDNPYQEWIDDGLVVE